MESVLEKLDRKLGQWLDTMDEQLQEPLVHSMTGEVFTHGTSANDHNSKNPGLKRIMEPATAPHVTTRDTRTTECDPICPPLLRQADAS